MIRKHLQSDFDTAVAEFTRTKGVTRCPTACLAPTQGEVNMADRAALEAHAAVRDLLRRAKAANHARSNFYTRPVTHAMWVEEAEQGMSFGDESGTSNRDEALGAKYRRTNRRSNPVVLGDEVESMPMRQSSLSYRSVRPGPEAEAKETMAPHDRLPLADLLQRLLRAQQEPP
jgi:hypothetical protein